MRLLIYGAGVIGCWYGALFSKAGYDTTIYARGQRLELLQKEGLRYEVKGKIHKADVKVIGSLEEEDNYDFIFLTVKENQVHIALEELSYNISPNIVTMVNTIEGYENWERLCGEGRIIPAFPGAGGSFQDGILKASLTPYIIQPTTFAEINGCRTERLRKLSKIFKSSKIPYQIVKNMQDWQLCHLAMVVPIADAYYMAKNPPMVWKESDIMKKTAVQMKENFIRLHKSGIVLSPKKMNMFRLLPVWVLKVGLTLVFKSNFGDIFMYQHSMNAPDEMRALHEQFYGYLMEKKRMLGIYFSGTGNSKYALEVFLREYGKDSVLFAVEDKNIVEQIDMHDEIVFSYPVQYSAVPKILSDFIHNNSKLWQGKKIFIIATMALFSGDGAGVLGRMLEQYGAEITGGLHLQMPDSIADEKVLKRSYEKNLQLVKDADKKIVKAVTDIKNGKYPQEGLGLLPRMAGFLSQRLWFGHRTQQYSDKLKVDADKCVGCSKCVKICPTENIVMEENKARGTDQCTMCYRCVNMCPKQAITLLGKTVIEQTTIDKYL